MVINANSPSVVGNVNITVKCAEPADRVYLHTRRLDVSEDTIKVSSQTRLAPTFVSFKYDEEREFLILQMSHEFEVNEVYNLYMEFTGKLVKDPAARNGIYLSSYVSSNGTEM